jgi:hypothetical protein
MIARVAKVFLSVAGLAAIVSVAAAGIPDPVMSANDGAVMVGNARGGSIPPAPDLLSTVSDGYKLIIRDIGGNALPGVTVTFSFLGTGITVHQTQSGTQVANCLIGTLSAVTGGQGEAVFFPATVGRNSSAVPNVQIRANGVLMAVIRFPSIDLVPVGPGMPSSVNVADFNEFRLRFLNLAPYSNLDPACDYATLGTSAGVVDVFDLNVFRSEFLCGPSGGAPAPCSQTECP